MADIIGPISGSGGGGGGGGSGYATVQDNGTSAPQETTLNFLGNVVSSLTDVTGIKTNVNFASNLNAIAALTPSTASLIQGNGTTYVETATFTAGSVLYSDGTNITQDNANFNWSDSNYTLAITQPSSYVDADPVTITNPSGHHPITTLSAGDPPAPVLLVTADPSGSHGYGNHINLAGNPGGGATISREDGGLNDSWVQIYGGDYSGTNGGGIYINGNNSTGGDAGGVQTTFGLSTSTFDMYDYTQSILLFQVTNAGVLRLPKYTNYNVLSMDGSGDVSGISPSTSGYVLTSNGTGSAPTFQPASGGSSFTWSVVTTNTTLVKSNGYFANSASLITFTLPTTAAVGDTFSISGMNSGLFTIAQNAGQTVRLGNLVTTSGTGGSIASTLNGDGITLVCNVANTGFQVVPGTQGNFNVT